MPHPLHNWNFPVSASATSSGDEARVVQARAFPLPALARRSLWIFLVLIFLGSCSWFRRHKPVSEEERRDLAIEIKEAVELAGGSRVWVKGSRGESLSAEALAVPLAFDRVLSAIKGRAEKQGFDAMVRPLRSKGGWRAADIRFSREGEPAGHWRLREVPRLRRAAVVIDDLGRDLEPTRKLLELPYPLTFSVLPGLSHSAETADEAFRAGRVVMLHLPMEPEPRSPASPGRGAIGVGMSGDEVARIIQADLATVPHAQGVNNHMGSRATADPALMAGVMKVLAERRLFFVDSRTTTETVALSTARRLGVPAFQRSVFLDDTETTAYTLGQLREFRRVVEEQGAALAIGHPHPSTISALAQFLPEFERDDIQIVPASDLARLPEIARPSPGQSRRSAVSRSQ